MHGLSSFRSKEDVLAEFSRDRNVLHLGAVGETCQSPEQQVAQARHGAHSILNRVARKCVGVDTNRAGVDALREAGLFDNIMAADATTLARDQVPLESVDVIVAGDILEHMTSPESLLHAAARISDPETVLLLTTPNCVGLGVLANYARGRAIEGPDHKVSFNIYTLRHLLEAAGWQSVAAGTCYQPKAAQLNGRMKMVLGKRLLNAFPAFGGTIYVVAKQARPGSLAS